MQQLISIRYDEKISIDKLNFKIKDQPLSGAIKVICEISIDRLNSKINDHPIGDTIKVIIWKR